MGNASQINRSRNSVRVERRSDLNESDLGEVYCICEIFGESNDIIFNKKKSASLYFISKMLKGAHLPNVYLNGVLVKQVDSVKYLGHL